MPKNDVVAENYYIPHLLSGRFKTNPTDRRQSMLERMHARTFTEMCANRFDWQGFPPTMNLRYLELTLFNHGLAVVFEEPTVGLLGLAATQNGRMNMYGDPLGFRVFSPTINRHVIAEPIGEPGVTGRTQAGVTIPYGVPIWANYLRKPDLDIVYIYATKLAWIDRTIEINIMQARRTKVMTYGKNQQLTANNILQQIESGAGAIEVDSSMNIEDLIKSIDLSVDVDQIEKLSIVRARLKNEASELLGINNANQDKKERLVAAEVAANNDQVTAMRNVALNERQNAAARISERFGIQVTVDFHKPPVTDTDDTDSEDTDDTEDED
jgi:hypothetical protein